MKLIFPVAVASITAFFSLGITYAYAPYLPITAVILLAGFISGIVGYLMRSKEVKA
jgi:hypothetical protein